jgi:hypothetical protein
MGARGSGGNIRKGIGRWKWWKYVHMYVNGKIRSVETLPRVGEEDKGEWWRGEFNFNML